MAAFDFAKVKDPTFFKENVLNAHASFRTYASREEYLAGESSLALKLDGIWKFAYAKNYTSAIPGFEKTDYDCSGWDDIHVPAHIQMEGYDIPQYANVQYPWDGREEVQPGEIPQRFNPVASYVKYFELPESIQQTQRAALVTELPVVFVYEKENLDLIPLDLVGIQMQSKAAAVCGVNGGVLRLVRVVHHTILAVLDVGVNFYIII